MTVNLRVGMTAIRRDGARAWPVGANETGFYRETHPFMAGFLTYMPDGKYDTAGCPDCGDDIIAAGYPWGQLGAQVGDTVSRVWNGWTNSADDWSFVCANEEMVSPDSLYVIVKRAAKPADRPRAAHKLNLKDGDVTNLVAWQHGIGIVGIVHTWKNGWLWHKGQKCITQEGIFSLPKGQRPLFRVISPAPRTAKELLAHEDNPRAAEQPDTKPQTQTHVQAGHLHLEGLLAEQKPDKGEPERAGPSHIYTGEDGTWNCDLPHVKPDDVIVLYAQEVNVSPLYHVKYGCCTHRLTITFPSGSDVGTVTREKL